MNHQCFIKIRHARIIHQCIDRRQFLVNLIKNFFCLFLISETVVHLYFGIISISYVQCHINQSRRKIRGITVKASDMIVIHFCLQIQERNRKFTCIAGQHGIFNPLFHNRIQFLIRSMKVFSILLRIGLNPIIRNFFLHKLRQIDIFLSL